MCRPSSLRSAMHLAAADRISTSVSSISWIISRMIFSGSSAFSSTALMFALMMSLNREKIPMVSCSWLNVSE